MQQLIDGINKASGIEDQVLIGLVRASGNVKLALQLLNACRQADLGNDTNALLDALINFATKLQQIVGNR